MAIFNKQALPDGESALPGRDDPLSISGAHVVHGRSMLPPFPESFETMYVGMGCFWGAERLFWTLPGVWTTAVGYAGGQTKNPTYEDVCSGGTGHAEVVMVVFDPQLTSFETLLKRFWESHDPTQGMRQGNDRGTQYRSVILTTTDQQMQLAETSKDQYQSALSQEGKDGITTAISPLDIFYYAEEYHQQYLAKNVNGYCGLGGTGVCMPAE